MGLYALIIAFGLVLLFGFWSRRRRISKQRKQELKQRQGSKVNSFSGTKNQTRLRRIK